MNPASDRRLKKSSQIVVKDCLGIKKGEKVVIVTDEPCRTVAYALWSTAKEISDTIIIEIPQRKIHGEEPPQLVAQILKNCDVFIAPTSHSLTHTRARIEAINSGARGATMPGITAQVMVRSLNANYKKIARLSNRLADMLSRTEKVILKTHKHTLELRLGNRKGYADTGLIKNRKDFSNLPAGEAYIAPIENRSNGAIVIDGSFAPIGLVTRPVSLKIVSGEIVRLKGNKKLKEIFDKFGKNERILCELGIGTNYKARITGNVLEDEKVLGSVHIAFGNNLGFGGINKARMHLDGVIKRPSIWFDDKLIIKKGKFLL